MDAPRELPVINRLRSLLMSSLTIAMPCLLYGTFVIYRMLLIFFLTISIVVKVSSAAVFFFFFCTEHNDR